MTDETTDPDDTDEPTRPAWADELLDNQRELIDATEDLADAVREHYA